MLFEIVRRTRLWSPAPKNCAATIPTPVPMPLLIEKKKKFTGPKDFYTVREGDTLYGVSQQFGIKVANLAKLNRMEVSEKIHPGEKLKLK